MTQVPKIVHDRLRSASFKQTDSPAEHLDANLLTAFAEQALSAAERDGVIEHLAICGVCREVVSLALPAVEIGAVPIMTKADAIRADVSRASAPVSRSVSFGWPSLRLAALAAGVAVAGSVLLLHPWKQNVTTLPASISKIAVTAPPPANLPATSARSEAAGLRLKSQLQLSNDSHDRKTLSPPDVIVRGALVAEKHPVPAAALDMPASRVAREANEVSATNAAVATAAAPSDEGMLMAGNEAPAIAKAKPVPPGIEGDDRNDLQKALKKTQTVPQNTPHDTKTAAITVAAAQQPKDLTSAASLSSSSGSTSASNVAWAINGGVLKRSLDHGQTWQSTLHSDHPLLCYASHGQSKDVWAGGQAGALYHSSDGGVTWIQLQPEVQGKALTSNITLIDLPGLDSLGITVSTANHEVWSSADGGSTWSLRAQ
jgi:hypothetical protein